HWLGEVCAALDNRPARWCSIGAQTTGRLHPAEVFRALRPYVERSDDTILICDGGEFAQWGQSMLPVRRRLINGVARSIGSSLAFPLAPQRLNPAAPAFPVPRRRAPGFSIADAQHAARGPRP